jgi:hypothetical protein
MQSWLIFKTVKFYFIKLAADLLRQTSYLQGETYPFYLIMSQVLYHYAIADAPPHIFYYY